MDEAIIQTGGRWAENPREFAQVIKWLLDFSPANKCMFKGPTFKLMRPWKYFQPGCWMDGVTTLMDKANKHIARTKHELLLA